MSVEIPPEAKDPAVWGSLTAVLLMRLPLLRALGYFLAGVAAAKFLEPVVAQHTGAPGAAAVYLGACFGLTVIEKLLTTISNVDGKAAASDLWGAILKRFGG